MPAIFGFVGAAASVDCHRRLIGVRVLDEVAEAAAHRMSNACGDEDEERETLAHCRAALWQMNDMLLTCHGRVLVPNCSINDCPMQLFMR